VRFGTCWEIYWEMGDYNENWGNTLGRTIIQKIQHPALPQPPKKEKDWDPSSRLPQLIGCENFVAYLECSLPFSV